MTTIVQGGCIVALENDKQTLREFAKDLDELLEKYPSVSMWFGCGCCSAGIECGDVEYDFADRKLNWEEEGKTTYKRMSEKL